MSDWRESYARQMEQAVRRLPRGHVIHHVQWRDGRLLVQSHKPPRERGEAAPAPRVRRGMVQEQLL